MGAAAAVAAVVVSCAPNASPRPAPSAAPSPAPPASPTNPPLRRGPRVEIAATGATQRHLARAVRDLKRIELWRPLTKHLYVVKLGARPGRANVPLDDHLADAVRSGYVDGRGQGLLCDVLMFPAAVAADLARWRQYHAAGLLPEPAPSRRHFWAAIVGHEIAHCLAHRAPERVALEWERRVLERLQGET